MRAIPLGSRDVLFAAAAVLVVSLHLALRDVRPAVAEDSRSTAAGGKKAFALLAADVGRDPARSDEPIAAFARGSARDTVLVLAGPARDPSPSEWDALLAWVERGGALLFAPRPDVVRGEEEDAADAVPVGDTGLTVSFEGAGPRSFGDEEEDAPTTFTRAAGLDPAAVALHWPSRGTVSGGGTVLVRTGDDAVRAAAVNYGAGRVVVVAGDAVFANAALARGDTAVLAFRLLESADRDTARPRPRVVFEESLNRTGTPKVVALLLDREFRPLTVQLALLAVLFAWWRSRPFARPEPPPPPGRRSLTDHSDAVGDLAWRTGDGGAVLGWYRTFLGRELRLPPGDPDAAALARLARRAGEPSGPVGDLFARADAAGPAATRRTAAGLIRELARLRGRVRP